MCKVFVLILMLGMFPLHGVAQVHRRRPPVAPWQQRQQRQQSQQDPRQAQQWGRQWNQRTRGGLPWWRQQQGWTRSWFNIAKPEVIDLEPAPSDNPAWIATRAWTAEEEDRYSEWFRQISARPWRNVQSMFTNPQYNSLYDPEDRRIQFDADCGDLPFTARAYYAYRRKLPFIYNQVYGQPDVRYARNVGTGWVHSNVSRSAPIQDFFEFHTRVHSGNFRTTPERTDSYSYPVEFSRQAIRPGTIFYDPTGHVALVADVDSDGTVYLLDGHPDQTVTRIRFGSKLKWRTSESGEHVGGFKLYRPVFQKGDRVVWEHDNSKLPFFSTEQYTFGDDYYRILRQRLQESGVAMDPIAQVESYIKEDILMELNDRVQAVDIGWNVGRNTAIERTPNIYASEGDWEDYSTPSRDIRVRLSFLGLVEEVNGILELYSKNPRKLDTKAATLEELRDEIIARKENLFEELTVSYTNSRGVKVPLTIAEVEQRLFRLSFDPNHIPELRWGATGQELAQAITGPARYRAGYEEQQYWRNRLEKKEGEMHPNDPDNPRQPPIHDISYLINRAAWEIKNPDEQYPSPAPAQEELSTHQTSSTAGGQPMRSEPDPEELDSADDEILAAVEVVGLVSDEETHSATEVVEQSSAVVPVLEPPGVLVEAEGDVSEGVTIIEIPAMTNNSSMETTSVAEEALEEEEVVAQ